MSVELPVAPVDTLIRREAGSLRVSADAAETLARRIQERGAKRAQRAAEHADTESRKTLRATDFGVESPEASSLVLPIAPVDRIARLDLDDRYRVGSEARVALAELLEADAGTIAAAAAILARHAGRRTIGVEDITTYEELQSVCER